MSFHDKNKQNNVLKTWFVKVFRNSSVDLNGLRNTTAELNSNAVSLLNPFSESDNVIHQTKVFQKGR